MDGKTGFLTEIGDVNETTKALDTILSDRALAAELGKQAEEHIDKNWNWNTYVSDILAVYNTVEI